MNLAGYIIVCEIIAGGTDGNDKVVGVADNIGVIGVNDGVPADGVGEGVEKPVFGVF